MFLLGLDALDLTYKVQVGRVANVFQYRNDEPRLEVAEQGRIWSFDCGSSEQKAKLPTNSVTPSASARSVRPRRCPITALYRAGRRLPVWRMRAAALKRAADNVRTGVSHADRSH